MTWRDSQEKRQHKGYLDSFKASLAQNTESTNPAFHSKILLWPGVSSAESPWWPCLTSGDIWCWPPSPFPPATGPGSGTSDQPASVCSAWSTAGSVSPPDGPGRPPTHAEQCLALGPQFEGYPRGLLSLCWSAQRRAKTGRSSSGPAVTVR